MIYHIANDTDWRAAQATDSYRPGSLESEGFIHCSTQEQVERTANRLFRGQSGLLLLVIDPARLEAELLFEESEPGEWFPHIYGPLNLDAVSAMLPFEPETNGEFRLPER